MSELEVNNRNTLYGLQVLRAIAAAVVLIDHQQNYLHVRNHIDSLSQILRFGSVGVDIFFVISGFIMVYVCRSRFGVPGSVKDFFVKRIIRVAPTYWIYTVSLAALLYALPQLFSDGKSFDLHHFVASLFFIPWENSVGLVQPVLGVGWTLNSEMYFYLCFALLLLFPRKYMLKGALALLLPCVLAASLFDSVDSVVLLSAAKSPLVLEFVLGMFIGFYYIEEKKVSFGWAWCLLLVGLFGYFLQYVVLREQFGAGHIHLDEFERFLLWGVPSAFFVAGVVFLERNSVNFRWPVLVQLGDSSYSLYLSHIFTINLVGLFWFKIFENVVAFYILAFGVSLIVGHCLYLVLEKPLTNWIGQSYAKRMNGSSLR